MPNIKLAYNFLKINVSLPHQFNIERVQQKKKLSTCLGIK